MPEFINEEQKRDYIDNFWNGLEPLVEKDVLRKRAMRTRVNIKEGVSSDRLGKRYIYEVTNGNKLIKFSLDITPWLWQNGSLAVQFELLEVRNLVIPKRRIEQRPPKPKVWRPGESHFWFIDAFEPMRKYIKAVELTAVDVGLFDNIEQAVKNLFT